ncbi:RagB/SusD family nutrient uptake outer membrane protein [Aestuariibaculum sediminum]|uniref:RagB/SusD family nutrient uptake outer membrane protein n=1 Tax=Aestuariibaculum sediminum TaxID=2770637 RepID=A0A8J6Q9L1_9FLAO|nr:RagB/SusD family nutrient uptake outer membrane protein [Aestuariibaculum sediminum]MBD0832572.1 RagB/SusD family nutrient uptake outer membrane protein [Aestuariibaculum sediminum]
MMKRNIYILMGFVMAIFSCESPDDFLDVIPTGRVIPSTVEDFNNLLNSPDYFFRRQENISFKDPDVFMNELSYSTIANNMRYANAYMWENDLFLIDQADADYNRTYQMLYISNFVLDGINDAELGAFNENERKNIQAEAHAQRAMELFLAVTEYAPMYDPNNRDVPGVPMPLEVDITTLYSKSSVGEVYDQIVNDLNKSLELISPTYPNINIVGNYRPGKASIYALLAEVHLYMGNFQEAKTNSDKALALYDYLNDWTTFEFQDPDNITLGYVDKDYENRDGNTEALWNRFHREVYYNPVQLYHPDLEALFDKDNDSRWYLRASQTDRNGNDYSPYYVYYFPITQVGMTVPRLLLTNAEAKVRTGDGAGAMASLNKLLAKRLYAFTPLTHTDNALTLQIIKDERRKELHGSGLNLFDLARYHVYGETVPTFTRTNPETGATATLEPGSDDYYVQIPLQVQELNPNLKQ